MNAREVAEPGATGYPPVAMRAVAKRESIDACGTPPSRRRHRQRASAIFAISAGVAAAYACGPPPPPGVPGGTRERSSDAGSEPTEELPGEFDDGGGGTGGIGVTPPTGQPEIKIGTWNISAFSAAKADQPANASTSGYQNQNKAQFIASVIKVHKFAAFCLQEVQSRIAITRLQAALGGDYTTIEGSSVAPAGVTNFFTLLVFDNTTLEQVAAKPGGVSSGSHSATGIGRMPTWAHLRVKDAFGPNPSTGKQRFDFLLACTHFAHPNNMTVQTAEFQAVNQLHGAVGGQTGGFAGLSGSNKDVIVAGDFNRETPKPPWDQVSATDWTVRPPPAATRPTANTKVDYLIYNSFVAKEDYARGILMLPANLSSDITSGVSDHVPVYATFYSNQDTKDE